MRVFVAGATGAIGRRLIPLLMRGGHQVTGMSRSASKAASVRAQGASAVIADALDREAVRTAVLQARPDVIVHQMTAIPGSLDFRKFEQQFAPTNRLRTEGLDNLMAAAAEAGCRRIVAQSFAGWPYARQGGPVKSEEDPLDPAPPEALRRTLDAIRHVESSVTAHSGGAVLRYGAFYGPGTSLGEGGELVQQILKRRVPMVGGGTGVWSFIHVEDAAQVTAKAIELPAAAGIYNIVDDAPAAVSEWLPALADALGAKPPVRVPTWLARLLAGEAAVVMMTEIRGASNAKARRELAWSPRWSTWREGFRRGLRESR